MFVIDYMNLNYKFANFLYLPFMNFCVKRFQPKPFSCAVFQQHATLSGFVFSFDASEYKEYKQNLN